MLIVGQSLECWRPPLADAVARRDIAPLLTRARRQLHAGAHALDVNFGAQPHAALAGDLVWAASALRASLPGVTLFLDCGAPEALATALRAAPGPVVANAVPLEDAPTPAVAALLDAVAASGAGAVCSPRVSDHDNRPQTILAAAEAARFLAQNAGISGPLYLDCFAYPPASHPEQCRRSLTWLQTCRQAGLDGIETLVAVGNVRHGVPGAGGDALEQTYVALAVASGATAVILHAEDSSLMSLLDVMEGRRVPDTEFARWALRVCALPRCELLSVPPPGAEARLAWELLTG